MIRWAPVRQLDSNPIAVSGSGHSEKQTNPFHAVIHMQENLPHKWFLVGCSSPFMRLAEETPHDPSRWVLAMSAWSVNTRRAPSRHCRDGRVYTTTAMHDNDCTPPLLRTLIFLTSSFLWSNFSSHLVDPVCIIGATFLSIMILVVKLYLLTCCEDNPTY